jgi:O-antigen/teichoic acid export membrane protein
MPTLKTQALQGGIHLVLRQIVGVALSVVTVLVVARLLGPEHYGIFAIAAGVLYFSIETGRLGLDVYLIRTPALSNDAPQQMLAFYNTVGLLLCIMVWLAIPLTSAWVGDPIVSVVLRSSVPIIWLGMVSSIPIAMLEREMRFDQVGFAEAISQIANCLVTVSLVLFHWSFWGPIVGMGTQFFVLTILAFRFRPVPFTWRWQPAFMAAALKTSLMFVGSNWIWALKSLTIPLLVSRLAGLEAVGILSIAIRLAEQLGILRTIAYRLSISTLARLNGDTVAMRRAISRGLTYQGLLVGPLYAVFSCCSVWLVPLLFGKAWLSSTQIFPLIAFAMLVNTFFNLHSSALYAVGRNSDVAVFHLWHIGCLWTAICLFAPSLGLWCYPAAEIVTLLSYIAIHRSIVQFCGSPDYNDAFWLLIATTPALLAGPWLPFALSISNLIASYALLLLLKPSFQGIPKELYAAWRSPKAQSVVSPS